MYHGNPPGERELLLELEEAEELKNRLPFKIDAQGMGRLSLTWVRNAEGRFLTISCDGELYTTISEDNAEYLFGEISQAFTGVTYLNPTNLPG